MTSPTGIPIDQDVAELEAIVATELERLARLANLGNGGTAGPDQADPPPAAATADSPRFVDGWWVDAIRKPAHPGRMGGAIRSIATGLHTTDMPPEDFSALVIAWTTKPGDGACANFLFGRTEADGIVQLVPITHNSNHMGGPGHGVFVINGQQVHPNTIANGIELHCAGGVRQVGGAWRFVEDGKAHGAPLPDSDVIPDPQRPGRGWHIVTEYQYKMLDLLLRDLDAVQAPLPAGTTIRAFGEVAPPIAHGKSPRVVTHWEMDPVHRGDPWSPTCAWLRGR
jgi:hypothetical protein